MDTLAALLVAAAAALLIYEHARKGAPRMQPGEKVALFGDSLAQGLRVPLQGQATGSGVKFASDTQQGTRLDQWITRGPAIAQGANYALISLGTNDAVASEAHRAKAAGYAKTISASLHSMGVTPIWILPPPMKFPTDQIKDAIRATGDVTLDSADYPRYDGIHPTPAAFQQWAADIWSEVGPGLGPLQLFAGEPPPWDGMILRVPQGRVKIRPAEVRTPKIGTPEVGVAQTSFDDFCLPEVCVPKAGLSQIRTAEVGAAEVGAAKVGFVEVGSIYFDAFKIGPVKTANRHVRSAQVGTSKIDLSHFRVIEVGVAEVGAAQVGAAEVGFSEICPLKHGALHVGLFHGQPLKDGALHVGLFHDAIGKVL